MKILITGICGFVGGAAKAWDWSPKIPMEKILDEIARHVKQNPNWLEISGS
jgi:nucleoside-diphosphate-sugar epimerase